MLRRSDKWNKTGKRSSPMKRHGKGSRRTNKSNAMNKKRFEKEGIDCCQLCGRTSALSNSHSKTEDRRDVNAKTALLCIWPCHQFLETKCSAEERANVNEFLINSDLEGEEKFHAAMKFLPQHKVDELLLEIAHACS